MNVNLNDIFVVNYNAGIADRFKIFSKLKGVGLDCLISVNNEFGAIGEGNFFVRNSGGRTCFFGRSYGRSGVSFNYFSVAENRKHTLKYCNKTLTAGVNYAGFFKHGKHFRSFGKSFLSAVKRCFEGDKKIVAFCHGSSFRCNSCNGKNCTLGRFHNRFICGGNAFCKGVGEILARNFFFTL